MAEPKPTKICICGGGNGAHTLTGLSSSRPNVEVTTITLFQDEAERWAKELKTNDMTVVVTNKDGSKTEIKSKPKLVTKNAKEAVSEADMILFCVPAFAHEEYFKAIEPYVQKGVTIVGLPGQPGFEFQCRDIFGEKASQVAIMCFETLPWATRIAEFGKKVEVLGTKSFLTGSIILGKVPCKKPPLVTVQMLHGPEPLFRQAKHFLEILLMGYSFVHPAILYGRFKDWDGKPLDQEPLFYQGIDESTADLLAACSNEGKEVAKAIMKARPEVNLNDVKDIYDWYMEYYKDDIEDSTNLYTAIRTNKSYKGLTHPMNKEGKGFVPNFASRYLVEELPMGMTVFKGVAICAGVETPKNDMLLYWGQKLMGKEYLVDGKLTGKNVGETRCPQRFGITTLEGVLTGKKE